MQFDHEKLDVLLNTAESNGKRQRPSRANSFDDARRLGREVRSQSKHLGRHTESASRRQRAGSRRSSSSSSSVGWLLKPMTDSRFKNVRDVSTRFFKEESGNGEASVNSEDRPLGHVRGAFCFKWIQSCTRPPERNLSCSQAKRPAGRLNSAANRVEKHQLMTLNCEVRARESPCRLAGEQPLHRTCHCHRVHLIIRVELRKSFTAPQRISNLETPLDF